MTVVQPNSIAGINSITALGDKITFHKSDGSSAGLIFNNANFSNTTGVSTFTNINITGAASTISANGNATFSGIITASNFVGDGSGLSNVGMDTSNVSGSTLNIAGVSTSTGGLKVGTAATISANGNVTAGIVTAQNVTISSGAIDLKNSGSVSNIKLYCESSNAHYTALQSAAHSAYSGNVTITLPTTTDTLVARTTTDTLTNKTLSAPSITGDVDIADKIVHTGDTDTAIRFPDADTVTVETGGSEKVRITSNGELLVGTASGDATYQAHIKHDTYGLLKLETSLTGADGSYLALYHNSSSPADSDQLGVIEFKGKNSADEETTYAQIQSRSSDVTDGTEDGYLAFQTRGDGTFAERLRITSTGDVGIGTINPTRGPLHIHQQTTGDCQIHLTNDETGYTSSDGFTIFAGGNAGPNAGFVNRETGGDIQIYTHNGSSVGLRLTIEDEGDLVSTAAIKDSLGNVRSIPKSAKTANYQLVAADGGTCVTFSGSSLTCTVPHNTMTGQTAVTILNIGSADLTIAKTASMTLYNTADGNNGNRTLAAKGMATIYFEGQDTGYISGSGLS